MVLLLPPCLLLLFLLSGFSTDIVDVFERFFLVLDLLLPKSRLAMQSVDGDDNSDDVRDKDGNNPDLYLPTDDSNP